MAMVVDREALYRSAEAHYVAAAAAICRDRGRRDLIEDMEQEARMALWLFAQSYDPDRNDSFSAAANLRVRGAILDALRKYQREVVRNSSLPPGAKARRVARLVPLDEARDAAVREPAWKEALPAQWTEILRPREEICLRLYYFEGLKHREIAQQLHVSESRALQIRNRGLSRIMVRIGRVRLPLPRPDHERQRRHTDGNCE